MSFEHLGPFVGETRTPAVCQICGDFIYKQLYFDESCKDNHKVVFVCKNCLNNKK